MDNASKALIMAGAILISVALVGVGVYLYQMASGTVSSSSAELNASEVMLYNDKFYAYMDKPISGREVKNFINAVIASNAKNQSNPVRINVYSITVPGISNPKHMWKEADLRKTRSVIVNSKMYTITMTHTCTDTKTPGGVWKDGRIACVSIKPQ